MLRINFLVFEKFYGLLIFKVLITYLIFEKVHIALLLKKRSFLYLRCLPRTMITQKYMYIKYLKYIIYNFIS